MSSYAQLDDLEMILSDGYGWDFEDEFAPDMVPEKYFTSNVGFRLYKNDNVGMGGVTLYLVDLNTSDARCVVIGEGLWTEGICPLFSWDDDFDYTEFQALLRRVWDERH